MILLKLQYSKIWPFLTVPYSSFKKKKKKNRALEPLCNLLLSNWSRLLNWKENLIPVLKIFSSNSWKLLSLFISIGQWVVVQKIYSKMHPVSCTLQIAIIMTSHGKSDPFSRGRLSYAQTPTKVFRRVINRTCKSNLHF